MLKNHIRRSILFGIVFMVVLGLYAFMLPKQYEGRSELLVGAALMDKYAARPTAVPDDVLEILERGQPQSYVTELEVLRSQGTFVTALQRVAQQEGKQELLSPDNIDQLFRLYEVAAVPQSSLASITARAYDPQTAANLANAVMDVYNESRADRAKQANADTKTYLDAQVASAKKDVTDAEARVSDLKKSQNIVDLPLRATALSNENQTLNQLKTSLASQLDGANAEVQTLQTQLGSTPKRLQGSVAEGRNPEIDRLVASLNQLQTQEAQLSVDYSSRAPQLVQVRDQIRVTQSQLAKARRAASLPQGSSQETNPTWLQLQQQVAVAASHRDSVRAQISQVTADLARNQKETQSLQVAQTKLADLQRSVDLADARYRQIQTVSDSLVSRQVTNSRAAQVLLTAVPAPGGDYVAPNIPKYILFGLVGGIALGLIYSLSIESIRLRVYDSAQLAEATGIAAVAVLPASTRTPLPLIARGTSTAVPEALKYVAFTGLVGGVPKYRTVLFTQTGDSVGAPSCALQYAIALAQTGVRALLVDADLHRGPLTTAFEQRSQPGLSDLIERHLLPGGDTTIVRETKYANLLFVPAGGGQATAVTTAPTQELSGVIEYLQDNADVVVIYAPPCDQYADAARLASMVDETFLVITAKRTSLISVPKTRDLLVNAGAKDVQVMIFGADSSEEGFMTNRVEAQTV